MLPSDARLSSAFRLPEYFRRMLRVSQMDFDHALSQMAELCTAPEKVFRDAKHRKLTKNHWSRDDPAFLVLLVSQIICVCVGYYIAVVMPENGSLMPLVKMVVSQVLINFAAVGLLASRVMWVFAKKYLHGRGQMHEVRQPLEWQYSFDIHCNGSFAVMLLCGVVQLLFLPFLLQETFIALALSNLLYTVAFSLYFYITFRGYLELPFLEGQEVFLYPIFFITLCYLLSLATSFNCTVAAVNGMK